MQFILCLKLVKMLQWSQFNRFGRTACFDGRRQARRFCDNAARHHSSTVNGFHMDFSYLLTPLLTWLVVGPIKFLINSARQRRWAFNLVGNGGFPSNHSATVTSMATLIALREGIGHPAFGVAVTLCFIVMIDANSLRQHVGRQAAAINRLAEGDGRPQARCASAWATPWSRSAAASSPAS